jgi:hypothetical protein
MVRTVARYVVLAFGLALVAFTVIWTVAEIVAGEWANVLLGTLGIVLTMTLFGVVRRMTEEP